MLVIHKIPTDVFVDLLSLWCDLKDISRLDASVLSFKDNSRILFLESILNGLPVLQRVNICLSHQYSQEYNGFAPLDMFIFSTWVNKRKVRLVNIAIFPNFPNIPCTTTLRLCFKDVYDYIESLTLYCLPCELCDFQPNLIPKLLDRSKALIKVVCNQTRVLKHLEISSFSLEGILVLSLQGSILERLTSITLSSVHNKFQVNHLIIWENIVAI